MKNKTLYIWIAVAIVVVLGYKALLSHVQKNSPDVSASSAMVLEDGPTPWPAEWAHLRERLASIGLPALSQEGTVLHIHQHLDLLINGQSVPVPMGVGIDPTGQFISPIHVHDTSGIVHVESPTVQTFTLGQFFDIWGLKFTHECIGGYCTGDQASLRVYVNGQPYQGDPRSIALAAHQEIFVFYGAAAQLPKTIPARFAFPAGY
jgi:hypothetical protein